MLEQRLVAGSGPAGSAEGARLGARGPVVLDWGPIAPKRRPEPTDWPGRRSSSGAAGPATAACLKGV